MRNLLKMEWYKLRTTKMFYILLAITAVLNVAIMAIIPIVTKLIAPKTVIGAENLSEVISQPFALGLMLVMVFISAVSYFYSDMANGYIKNIAGQVKNRGSIVFAKFIVVGIHNLIFFIVGAASCVLGVMITGRLAVDASLAGGIATLLMKWLLSIAICSILLFFVMGLKSKTFASIMAVIFATGSLSLLYAGISTAITNLFHQAVDIGAYAPDALLNSVNAITNVLVLNSILVAVGFTALFIALTYFTFKKRDVK